MGVDKTMKIVTDLERLLGDLVTLITVQGAYSMFIPQRNIETGHGTSYCVTLPQ